MEVGCRRIPDNRAAVPVNRINVPAVCNTGHRVCCPEALSADRNRDHVRDCRHPVYQTVLGWAVRRDSVLLIRCNRASPHPATTDEQWLDALPLRCWLAGVPMFCMHCRSPAARVPFLAYRPHHRYCGALFPHHNAHKTSRLVYRCFHALRCVLQYKHNPQRFPHFPWMTRDGLKRATFLPRRHACGSRNPVHPGVMPAEAGIRSIPASCLRKQESSSAAVGVRCACPGVMPVPGHNRNSASDIEPEQAQTDTG